MGFNSAFKGLMKFNSRDI